MELYGQTSAEKLAKDSEIARQIVQEVSNFGVDDRQRCLIMYYLSLELENLERAQVLAGAIKEICPDMLLTSIYEGEK